MVVIWQQFLLHFVFRVSRERTSSPHHHFTLAQLEPYCAYDIFALVDDESLIWDLSQLLVAGIFGLSQNANLLCCTMIWNPIPHIQNAWSGAKTVWGKIALILFYALIWVGILTSLWSVIVPGSQGVSCYFDAVDEQRKLFDIALFRSMNIFVIGFLLYADVGGLKTKNVCMVSVFIVASTLSMIPILQPLKDMGCSIANFWIWPLWAILALIFMILEDNLGDHGGSDETTPLNA